MRKVALFWFGLVVTALVALGLVVLSSASEANGVRLHADAYYFMKRQGIYLVVGVLVAVCAASFDYHKWRLSVSDMAFLRGDDGWTGRGVRLQGRQRFAQMDCVRTDKDSAR